MLPGVSGSSLRATSAAAKIPSLIPPYCGLGALVFECVVVVAVVVSVGSMRRFFGACSIMMGLSSAEDSVGTVVAVVVAAVVVVAAETVGTDDGSTGPIVVLRSRASNASVSLVETGGLSRERVAAAVATATFAMLDRPLLPLNAGSDESISPFRQRLISNPNFRFGERRPEDSFGDARSNRDLSD